MNKDFWGKIQEELQETIGKNNFTNWISPLEFSEVTDGVATFNVPTTFLGNYVSQNFGDIILFKLNNLDKGITRVAFQVNTDDVAKKSNSKNEERVTRSTKKRSEVIPGAPLDPRFTFDSFIVGKPNELAHAAARRVADGTAVTFNPLFLYGGVGLGKTHLMHAIAWELSTKRPDLNVLYLSAEQFMYRFVQSLRERKMMDFKQIFRSVDILMVDDVQFIAGKDSTQEEFFHTFNSLVDQKKQIIVSGDRSPSDLEGVGERLRSRLSFGVVGELHKTDYELRVRILKSKVNENKNVKVDNEIIEHLAKNITSNVRELEGAYRRLCAHVELVNRPLTIDTVKQILHDIFKANSKNVTIEEIQKRVSEYFNIRQSDMLSTRRSRVVARPRQIAMYLSKICTTKSLPEIGKLFGGRDHTTVIHAVKKVESLYKTDISFSEHIKVLKKSFI